MRLFNCQSQHQNTTSTPLPIGKRQKHKAMRVLIKVEDGMYQVETVNSVDEAFAISRQLGGHWWDHIGWQESI